MSRTSNCPQCTQPVTIPEGVDSSATVRCPTCEAEYPLSEAVAAANEAEAENEEKPSSDAMAFLRSLEGGGEEPTPPELVVVRNTPEGKTDEGTSVDETPGDDLPDTVLEEEETPGEREPEAADDQMPAIIVEVSPDKSSDGVADDASPPPEPAAESSEAMDFLRSLSAEQEKPSEAPAAAGATEGAGEKGSAADERDSAETAAPSQDADEDASEQHTEEESAQGQGTEPQAGDDSTAVEENEEQVHDEAETTPSDAEPSDEADQDAEEEGRTSEQEGEQAEQPPEASGEAGAGQGEGDSAGEGEPTPAAPPAVDPDPLVRGPYDEREFRLSELIVVSTGEALGAVTASMMVRHDLVRTLTETPAEESETPGSHLDFLRTGGDVADVAIDTGTGFAADDHSGFAIKDEELEQQEAAGGPVAARPRRKKKEKSLGREMVGIVLGGIAGVILASYAVVMIKGDQANFLGIPLPGCPSTYKHCPDWWPSWLKIGAKTEKMADSAGGETPAEPSKPPKQPSKASPQLPDTGTPKENPFAVPKEKPNAKPGRKSKPGGKAASKPDGKSKPKQPGDNATFSLAGFPSYGSDELGKGLAAANAALGCKECNGAGKITKMVTEKKTVDGKETEVEVAKEIDCPVCGGEPAGSLTRNGYDAFCRLAELRTFVDEASGEPQLDDRIRMVRTLLERIGQQEGNGDKIASLANERLADESRLEPGILLGGTVEKIGNRGSLQAIEVLLGKSGRKVVVVSQDSLPVNANDNVLVLGSIVEDPGMRFTGFTGPEPLVVFAKECVAVP